MKGLGQTERIKRNGWWRCVTRRRERLEMKEIIEKDQA